MSEETAELYKKIAERSVVKITTSMLSASGTFEATTPVNESGRAAHEWPGHLQLRLEYAGVAAPIELTGRSFSHHHADNVAPIWALVQGLRRDLAAAG